MDYVTLYNGIRVPVLGIGTFMITADDVVKAVYTALKGEYRLVDTANAYLNEEGVGRGIARAIDEGIVSREELFVSTKLWPTLYGDDEAVDETLDRLGLDYVDMLFIHQPAGNYTAGYRQLEKAYREGKARSIGVSNFQGRKLEVLMSEAQILPHVIQLEAHPYFTQKEIRERLAGYGTKMMSWYPLGHGDSSLAGEKIITALADKYHKSTAQIILRWHTQMGFITIPGSKNPDHIRDNIDIFDFSLNENEMEAIAGLDGTRRYYTVDEAMEEKYADMHLPFEEV